MKRSLLGSAFHLPVSILTAVAGLGFRVWGNCMVLPAPQRWSGVHWKEFMYAYLVMGLSVCSLLNSRVICVVGTH